MLPPSVKVIAAMAVSHEMSYRLGKAMDWYLPDVPLAKLRGIAMKMQGGGVGYYPRSGSPFVHTDTGNVRAWRHVISMRASAHAETEIRELAVRVFLCLYLTDPILFSDYTLEQLPDARQPTRSMAEMNKLVEELKAKER